jgi:hypothetical protein
MVPISKVNFVAYSYLPVCRQGTGNTKGGSCRVSRFGDVDSKYVKTGEK